jgi:heme-degrading monooxygenase HmoA
VLTRADADAVRITVLTFWDSMEAVRGFAGADTDRAVVEEEAQRLLLSFDETVQHDAIAVDTIALRGRT